jgi:hypothetical protein
MLEVVMELLESEWFFKMVESQGKTPVERLFAVFTVIGQWIAAPGIKEGFVDPKASLANTQLKTYLTNTASAAKAKDPMLLAMQLIILLQGAIAEELRDPGVNAMQNAAMAARAVIFRACQPSVHKRLALWSAVASIAVTVVAALVWQALPLSTAPALDTGAVLAMRHNPYTQVTANLPMGVNPSEMEAALNLQEQFERGVCPAPHLLALPPGQLAAYMNVVHFRAPENPEVDRANLHAFLSWYQQTRAEECYYAPVNGHTLVTWR